LRFAHGWTGNDRAIIRLSRDTLVFPDLPDLSFQEGLPIAEAELELNSLLSGEPPGTVNWLPCVQLIGNSETLAVTRFTQPPRSIG
jgi:hypothetical protein